MTDEGKEKTMKHASSTFLTGAAAYLGVVMACPTFASQTSSVTVASSKLPEMKPKDG
jgi:hypothetical protein